jgi:hypothetical protein
MMLLTGMVGMVITQDLQCDWVALHFHTPNMTQWHTIFLNLATSKTQQICETSSIFDGECIGKASINGGYNLMFPIEILFKKTIYIYIYLSICLSVCLSIYLSIYLSIGFPCEHSPSKFGLSPGWPQPIWPTSAGFPAPRFPKPDPGNSRQTAAWKAPTPN